LAIVTTRWDGMRWTRQRRAFLSPDEALSAYGQVVWSWRRDAGAKPVERSAGDGDNKPAHRGEHEVRRNTIAQGMPDCLRSPVCSCAPTAHSLAHETAGAARTRHSLLPLFWGRRICRTRAKRAARSRTHTLSPRRPCERRDPYAAADVV
jgi:hypothetical protein